MSSSLDPSAALAVTLESAPGYYALLLGSGVSSSAGVPTGWDVVEDVARKLAIAAGEDPDDLDDPIGWYKSAHGEDPDYSDLLEKVAPTASARQTLLASYFSPVDDDGEGSGDKQPSPAHRAIAELVASELVRVIVTTNFDRLTERAVQALGVDPVVVDSEDTAAGTTPLAHTGIRPTDVAGQLLFSRRR